LAAIITCSIICTTTFSCAYGIWRVSSFFGLSVREIALDWLRPMVKVLLFYLPFAGLTWYLLIPTSGPVRLGINALLAGSIGAYLFLRFGLPSSLQNELLRRVPSRAVPVLKRVFLQTAN
jgi:hypothetical protein